MNGLRDRLRRVIDEPRAPEVVLFVGALLIAVYAARYGVRVTTYALDEIVVKQQAVNYTRGLPGSLFHDLAARGPSRLYSLIQSGVFRLWSGDTAIRHAKEINAVLFASTALPVWLLAKRLLDSRWAAVAAGLLAIAAPWLALTTVIFTENLSYPLFVWVLLAMAWCLDRPSPRRDLVVVVLIGLVTVTRVQLWTLLLWWPLAILVIEFTTTDAKPLVQRSMETLKRCLRTYPFVFGVVALAVLYVVYLAANNTLQAKFRANLGTYSEIGYRDTLPSNYLAGLFAQIVHFAAALGILPVVAAFVYWASSLLDRRNERRWRIRVAIVTASVGMTLATLFAQFGDLGSRTEERYYIYLVPLAWIGALGLLERRDVKTGWLVGSAGALALLFATVEIATPLTSEYGLLAAGGASVGHIANVLGGHLLGITERDLLALSTVIVCVPAIWLWVKRPRWRWLWIGGPALFQIMLTIYVFGTIDGRTQGVPSRTDGDFGQLSFIDRNVPGDAPVTWLDAQRKPVDQSAERRQQFALFWNQKISAVAWDPALGIIPVTYPLSSVRTDRVTVDPRTGVVTSALPLDRVVQPAGSPFEQLVARKVVARSDERDLDLIETAKPVRARWVTRGLSSNGAITTKPAGLRAWGPGKLELTLRFAVAPRTEGGAPGKPNAALLRVGGRSIEVSPRFGRSSVVRLSTCAAGGPVVGTVRALRGTPVLVDVRVRVARTSC